MYKNLNSDRVMRWILFIEEYSPDLQYIKGENNIVADALSCFPKAYTSYEDSQESFYALFECHEYKKRNADKYDFHPLSYEHLELAQKRDPQLKNKLSNNTSKYKLKDFHGGGKLRSLICYKNKILVPKHVQQHVIDWYHITLSLPRINRTEKLFQTLMFAQNERLDHNLCANMPKLSKKQT
ncbi:MAG: hypothetical protein ORN50_02095 [Crocinitomicaceae bacterium]|nr:hypothetical protein [Crocinitomicaceae bacterium]